MAEEEEQAPPLPPEPLATADKPVKQTSLGTSLSRQSSQLTTERSIPRSLSKKVSIPAPSAPHRPIPVPEAAASGKRVSGTAPGGVRTQLSRSISGKATSADADRAPAARAFSRNQSMGAKPAVARELSKVPSGAVHAGGGGGAPMAALRQTRSLAKTASNSSAAGGGVSISRTSSSAAAPPAFTRKISRGASGIPVDAAAGPAGPVVAAAAGGSDGDGDYADDGFEAEIFPQEGEPLQGGDLNPVWEGSGGGSAEGSAQGFVEESAEGSVEGSGEGSGNEEGSDGGYGSESGGGGLGISPPGAAGSANGRAPGWAAQQAVRVTLLGADADYAIRTHSVQDMQKLIQEGRRLGGFEALSIADRLQVNSNPLSMYNSESELNRRLDS